MRRGRVLAGAICLLVAVALVPAVSAAQDPGAAVTPVDPSSQAPVTVPTTTTPSLPSTGQVTAGATGEKQGAGLQQGGNAGDSQTSPPDPGSAQQASPSAAIAQKAASASVTVGDFFFSPGSLRIAVGDTVTWRNTGQAPHNATADDGSFSTPNLANGQSASHTFTSPGNFSYICTIHPNMKGSVRVLDASGGGSSGGGSSRSESSAVASPGAAGDTNTLPMTGFAAGALALVGITLIASGLALRERIRERARWLPLL